MSTVFQSAWFLDGRTSILVLRVFIKSLHMYYCIAFVKSSQIYWYVITRSRLQLINTLIDIFFSRFCAFLTEQRRRRKANDGWMAQWTNFQWINRFVNPTQLYISCKIFKDLHLSELGLMAGSPAEKI